VTDWDFYYGFRVSDPKSRFETGPYSALTTITFKGELLEPVNSKYRRAEVTLSARVYADGADDGPPKSIGSLSGYNDALSGYIFVPAEHVAILVSIVSSGKVKMVSMIGSRLHYRSGNIQNISLDTSLDDYNEQK
jgi:hypothetical protein